MHTIPPMIYTAKNRRAQSVQAQCSSGQLPFMRHLCVLQIFAVQTTRMGKTGRAADAARRATASRARPSISFFRNRLLNLDFEIGRPTAHESVGRTGTLGHSRAFLLGSQITGSWRCAARPDPKTWPAQTFLEPLAACLISRATRPLHGWRATAGQHCSHFSYMLVRAGGSCLVVAEAHRFALAGSDRKLAVLCSFGV
jgi:hypothetical protein